MKSLFIEDRYSSDGQFLDEKTFTVLKPIFKKWSEKGYSAREISHIMSWTVKDVELETILNY